MNRSEIKDHLCLPPSPGPAARIAGPREPWSSEEERPRQKIVVCLCISVNNSGLETYTGMFLKFLFFITGQERHI